MLTGKEIADRCSNPEGECFQQDPEVLGIMLFMDDSYVRRDLSAASDAGHRAAINGVPLKGFNRNGSPVAEVTPSSPDYTLRAAKCGYGCGKAALGQCSVYSSNK